MAAALCLLFLGPWPQGQPAPPRGANPASEAAIRQLIVSLSPKSMWRSMIEHGARGDGVHRPWMDQMREQGIRLALLTFDFDWTQGGEGLKNLKNWRLASAKYFAEYDCWNSSPIADPHRLHSIAASGLEGRLEPLALARAKQGFWVEDPGHQHPPRPTGTGYMTVFLADNEWLPVHMFPWFGQYGQGTTPLMHAATLGDVERIKSLMAQGADVNAVSTDGSTALVYATEGESADAAQALLAAGADPNKATKDGGTPLMTAAAADDLRAVGLLLEAGANPNARDAEGNSALSIATQSQYCGVVKLLKQAGAHE